MFIVPVSRRAIPSVTSFDSLFDSTFDRLFGQPVQIDAAPVRRPALDVSESDGQYVVTLDIPGVNREDIKVSIDGRRVSIVAESKTGTKSEGSSGDSQADTAEVSTPAATNGRVILRERTSVSYGRSFTLPAEIDQAASQARLENGVLTLTLTKRSASTAHLTVN